MLTLEKWLQNQPQEDLLCIEDELLQDVIPATGKTHAAIRHVNDLIDRGLMCINPTTYRKMYLPSFAKAVHKEMARRYYVLCITQGGHYAKSNSNG